MVKSSSSYSRSRSPNKRRRSRNSSNSEDSWRKYKQPAKYRGDARQPFKRIESDIKNHIRFQNIKIRKKSTEDEIISSLKKRLSEFVGPVTHVTKIAQSGQSITLAIGFLYDSDALNYYQGKKGAIAFGEKDPIKLIPIATETFKTMISAIIESEKKNRETERLEKYEKTPDREHRGRITRKNKRGDSPDSKRSSRRRRGRSRDYASSSSSGSRQRYRRRSTDSSRSPRYKRKEERDRHEVQKKVFLFGIPSHLKGKEITNYLQHHPSGPIYDSGCQWLQVKNSNCEFLELKMDEKKCTRLLNLRDDLEIEGFPLIATNGEHDQEEKIKEALKEYQVKITFPHKMHPFHVYKGLSEGVGIIQMVTHGRLSEAGTAETYFLTLSNNYKAQQLKKIGKMQTGIIVEEPSSGLLVYRPTRQTKFIEDSRAD